MSPLPAGLTIVVTDTQLNSVVVEVGVKQNIQVLVDEPGIDVDIVGIQGLRGPIGPQGLPGTARFVKQISSDYYTDFAIDFDLVVDALSFPVNIYLPVVTMENNGGIITIKKIDSSENPVNVWTRLGASIDRLASPFVISYQNDLFGFESDGSNYIVR